MRYIFIFCISFLFFYTISIAQDKEIDKAVKCGLTYLTKNDNPTPTTIFALRYINDCFLGKQDSIDKFIKRYIKKTASDNESVSFMRLLLPGNFLDTQNISRWSFLDKITLAALYCDLFPVPDNYLRKLNSYADTSDIYLITHCSLALQFLHENKCFSSENSEYKELHTRLIKKTTVFLDSTETVNDPYVESVMMLSYVGVRGNIRESYIQKILKAQLPDGGWSRNKIKNYIKSDDHTTVLAVWALSAYSNSRDSTVTWIMK